MPPPAERRNRKEGAGGVRIRLRAWASPSLAPSLASSACLRKAITFEVSERASDCSLPISRLAAM
eukprot:6236128-Alexandrium_andersonii.AAC.1